MSKEMENMDYKSIPSSRYSFPLSINQFDKETLFDYLCLIRKKLEEKSVDMKNDIDIIRKTQETYKNDRFHKGEICAIENQIKFVNSLLRKFP